MPLATVDQFILRLRGGGLVVPDRLNEVIEALQRERSNYNSRQLAARLIEAGLLTPEVAAALLEGSTILTAATEPPGVNLSQAQVDDGSTLQSEFESTRRAAAAKAPAAKPAVDTHASDSIFDTPEGVSEHSLGEDSIFDVPEQMRAKTGDTFLGMSSQPAQAMEISVGNLDDDELQVLSGDMQTGQQLRETPTMVGRLSQIGNVRVELFTSDGDAASNAVSQVPPEQNPSLIDVLTNPPPVVAAPLAKAFAAPPPPARKGPVIPNQLLDEDDRTVANADSVKGSGKVPVQVAKPAATPYIPGQQPSMPPSTAVNTPVNEDAIPGAAVLARTAAVTPAAPPAVKTPAAPADDLGVVHGDLSTGQAARESSAPGLSEIHTSLVNQGPAEAAPQAAAFGFDAAALSSVASEPFSFGGTFVADDASPMLFSSVSDAWAPNLPAEPAPAAEAPAISERPDADAGIAAAAPQAEGDAFAALAGDFEGQPGTPTALGRMSQIARTAGLVELATPDDAPAARVPSDDPHDLDPEDLSGIGPAIPIPAVQTPSWSPWATVRPAPAPMAPPPPPVIAPPPAAVAKAATPAPKPTPAKPAVTPPVAEPPQSIAAQAQPDFSEMALGEDSMNEYVEPVWQNMPAAELPAAVAVDPLAEEPSIAVEVESAQSADFAGQGELPPSDEPADDGQWPAEPEWAPEADAEVIDELPVPMPLPSATPTLNAQAGDTLLQVPPGEESQGDGPQGELPYGAEHGAIVEPAPVVPPPGWDPNAEPARPAATGPVLDPWRDVAWEGHAPPPEGEEPPLLPPPKSLQTKVEEEELPVAPLELAVALAPRRVAPEPVVANSPPPAQWFEAPAPDALPDLVAAPELSLGAKIGIAISLMALIGMAVVAGLGLVWGMWASGAWPLALLLLLGAGMVLCLAILVAVRPGESSPAHSDTTTTTTSM